jgi:hypothetical protein
MQRQETITTGRFLERHLLAGFCFTLTQITMLQQEFLWAHGV